MNGVRIIRKRIEPLFLVLPLLLSLCLSGCITPSGKEPTETIGYASPYSVGLQSQRPFQGEMDVPGYLSDSFVYDEIAPSDRGSGKGPHVIPRYFWRKLLDSSMASLRYDCITRLCLYSVGSEAHYKRGFLMDILGYDDLAALEYTQAIEINPRNDRYYNNRGNTYLVRGFVRLAVKDFTAAIEINPRKAELYYNRGRALEMMGDPDGAERDYGKAVELGICHIYPSLKICK
jgi:tetratricopeptide (TPR) repeat protein